MSLRGVLNLRNAVSVTRTTLTSDGMGGQTSTTETTILSRASIWQPSSTDRRISDKITAVSSHVLAFETGAYTFNDSDTTVTYGSNTYNVIGHADEVGNRGELTIIGLERLT